MADEVTNSEELVNEFVGRFNTEINVQTLSSRSAIREEADRCKHTILQCFDKNLPIFESLSLGFSRKIELELVNYNENTRALRKEKLIQKLRNYDEGALADFTKKANKIIDDEGEALRENLRALYLEVTTEKAKQVTERVVEFQELVRENDDKRRYRVTEMRMPKEPNNDGKEKKNILEEIDRRKADFDTLLKTISYDFTELLSVNSRTAMQLIDHFIKVEQSVFGDVLVNFNDVMYRFYFNHQRIIHYAVEQAIESLSALGNQDFAVIALTLQQKAKQLYDKIESDLHATTEDLDKYRSEERREVMDSCAANRRDDDDDGMIVGFQPTGDTLYDGRMRRRHDRQAEINLDGVQLENDENYMATCELRKRVILRRCPDETEIVEKFAVQGYAHMNLLKCFGTGTRCTVRYLVFEHFEESLSSLMTKRPAGMNQDEFIQFSSGLQQAVQYLHENNLFHGDLQPDNVYLEHIADEGYYKVKLAHYSMSSARETVDKGYAQQNPFSAPEAGPESSLLLLQKSDVWSFGTVIWFALTGITPNEEKISELRTVVPETSSLWSLGDFLKRCWAEKPEDRLSVYEVGEQLRVVIAHIASTFEEDSQWTQGCAKWKTAAAQIATSDDM